MVIKSNFYIHMIYLIETGQNVPKAAQNCPNVPKGPRRCRKVNLNFYMTTVQ